MIHHSFNWARYWYESGERSIFEDGFLFLPENNFLFYLRNHQVEYLTLDALTEVPCLILLGERSMGKSTALAEFVQRQMGDETDSAVHVLRNLRDYSSSSELCEHVFQDNDALTSWEGGQHLLYLYLDSLDEGQLRIDTITQLLQRQLKEYRHHIDRLYLRIVCRTLDWSNDFEEQLRGLWGDGAVQSFTLAPLQKVNVIEAVEFHGLDAERFFGEVYKKDAAPLAASPLDLFLLLDYYQQNELKLPDTRSELYERGVLNRCRETNFVHRQRDKLSAEQRRVVAGRIAACSVFTNRPKIHASEVVVRNRGEASLLITEVASGTEVVNGVPFSVDEDAVCETLETQLFHGGDLRYWAHRKYETFLAAWYVTQIRQMPTPQLKNLLFHASGKLIPQLAETAAWIADYNDDIFEQIADSDPDILMQGNLLTLNDPIRSKLVERLLQHVRQGNVRYFTSNQLQYLCHSTIAVQLSPFLDNPTLLPDARRLAIRIAESCQVTEVQDSLERIALDSGESQRMRSSAIHALATLGSDSNKRKLRDLALLPFTESDNIELKESALFVVWSDYITAHELFTSLDVPEANRNIGAPVLGTSMPPFILSRMNTEHLPIALHWVVQLPKSPMRLPMALEYIAKGVIVLAWENLEDPAVLSAFAQAVLMLANRHDLYFLSETRTHLFPHTRSVGEFLAEDDTKRRLLLNALIPLVPDDHNWVRHLRYHPALYTDRDLTWLIERFTQSGEARERSLLAKMINGCCIWSPQSEETALLFNVIRGNDELAIALGTDFVSYLQTLYEQQEEAREGKHAKATADSGSGGQSLFYKVRKAVERITKTVAHFGYRMVRMLPFMPNSLDAVPSSLEERHAEPEAADPVIVDRIESCLKKCESGEYQAWVSVSAWMSCDKLNRPNPYYLIRTNIESLPAWNAFDATAHERLATTAQSFIEHYDPHDLEWRDDPLNRSREPMAGYRAFRLILSLHPDQLEVISPETWQRWAEIITFYGHYSLWFLRPFDQNDETPIATLLNLTYKFAPDEVLDTLDWIIANRSEAAVWDVLSRAKAVWDDKVAERLMAQLPVLTPKGRSQLLESLLRHGYEPAAAYAHSLLDSSLPDDAEAYEHIVQATYELLRYDAAEFWGTVWDAIERDEGFGRAVIEMLLERDFVNGLWLVKRIDNDDLHNLFLWLMQRYPANEDPPRQGIFSPTLRHTIADFRDGVLSELCERSDFTAIEAIAAQFPDQNFSRELESARLQYRHTSWTPLKPTEFLELMRNHDLRQITSGERLLELLEELLAKLSHQLQGRDQAQATVASLWSYRSERKTGNDGKKALRVWYPKDEEALSNFVAGFIKREAQKLIVGREVEVTAPSRDRTDILVQTFRATLGGEEEDVVTAVIEVKGNWHDEVQTAMQTQLVDKYLISNSWQHGLYLVAWFACSNWDSVDRRQRDKGKLGDDFESAKQLFERQAQDISKQTGLDVRSFVLDARLQ